ncbi:MAG: hypothetical protein CSA49_03030 [Gammaproteobacteria bacterium]|nr:MAG: hypothetical protein CSA49_03030 [Gammaproteobacteria bacterium]
MSLTSVILFLAGVASGAFGCFLIMRASRSESSIERQLRELQEEFTAYRENVNQHFNNTAKLVNKLTKDYISVQKHLEDAAESFTQPPKSFKLNEESAEQLEKQREEFLTLEASSPKEEEDAQFDIAGAQPPKDYAPKAPSEKGTLAEDYGLHKPAN